MGNYVSCTLATPLMKSSKAVRVIFPGGEIRQFRELVIAAEIMLECPNFFLTNAKSLHIGKRFSPLGAEEELELGNVYVMFPMRRVNSVVTAADMAALFMAANSAAKRISGGKMRVSPESGSSDQVERLENSNENNGSRLSLEGINEGFPVPEFKYRLVSCRSREATVGNYKGRASLFKIISLFVFLFVSVFSENFIGRESLAGNSFVGRQNLLERKSGKIVY